MESCMCGCIELLFVIGGLCLREIVIGDVVFLFKVEYCDILWFWDVVRGINEGLFLLFVVKFLFVLVFVVIFCFCFLYAWEIGVLGRYFKFWFLFCFKVVGFILYKELILLDNVWYSWFFKIVNSFFYNKMLLMVNYLIFFNIRVKCDYGNFVFVL